MRVPSPPQRRPRQSRQELEAREHFWARGDTPTVERSQQSVIVASFPHFSHDFRAIHTRQIGIRSLAGRNVIEYAEAYTSKQGVLIGDLSPERKRVLTTRCQKSCRTCGNERWIGATMNRAQVEAFFSSAEEIANRLGTMPLEQAVIVMRDFIGAIHGTLERSATREELARNLEREVPDELGYLLVAFVEYIPEFLRYGAEQLYIAASKSLPSPRMGRPAVSALDQAAVIRYVQHLYVDKRVSLKAAKMRAAYKFGWKPRTVDRYWGQRDRILSEGPKLRFADLFTALQELWKRDIASGKTAFELLSGNDTRGPTPYPSKN